MTPATVGVLVFDDVEELDFAGPYEVFGMAARSGAACSTVLVAADARTVRCRHGLRIDPDVTLEAAPELDILIVPGGLGARTHARADPRILGFVQRQAGIVASVCTGALILAGAGTLDGLLATTHHAAIDLLRQYPAVEVEPRVRFVMHARVATAAGVSSGIDLALALVERRWGAPLASAVARNLEWQPWSGAWGLRSATAADLLAMHSCLEAAFRPYASLYTEGAYADTVPAPAALGERLDTMTGIVATAGPERVIGTIFCERRGSGEGHLRGMAVRPEFQGAPVAATLLHGAEAHLRAQGCRFVTLDTTDALQRAIAFYRRSGYVATGAVADFFDMPLRGYAKEL